MEKQLSKYAAKQKRKAEQAERTNSVMNAINVAVQVTEGKTDTGAKAKSANPQRLRNHAFGKPTQPKRTFDLADLGTLPANCADAIDRAAKLLEFAETCANRMVSASACPFQTAEPRAIAQSLMCLKLKASALSPRARQIPSGATFSTTSTTTTTNNQEQP